MPSHRLEDEKIRKAIQNDSPLVPLFAGAYNSSQETSGANQALESIVDGRVLEDFEKGPNKGDILTGSVGWMRDLMWMLDLKMRQH